MDCNGFLLFPDLRRLFRVFHHCLGEMGYEISDNFKTPYLSKNIAEFWHRWHISLSTWFRDYVYIPMGGSRVKFWRWAWNILVVFVLSGIWHGANWTFLLWGLAHGLLHVVESGKWKVESGKRRKEKLSTFHFPLSTLHSPLSTFLLVTLLGVFQGNGPF